MMVLIVFSFFFSSSSKSFLSSSRSALLRDLVVVQFVVAAQFAVRIGNGFRRRRLRIRLVRPHLSKLLYACVCTTCATLYCLFF
jgi:hypothetical protein